MMPANPFELGGRTAIVTGASRGLGAAMARALARAGANTVLAARNRECLEAVAAEITGAGGAAHCITCDATRRSDLECLIATALNRFGGLDVMVVNHGIGPAKDLLEVNDEDIDTVIGTNLSSAYVCAQLAGRQMIAQGGGGSIILTSSASSRVAGWGNACYGASKGGIDQLVRQLAQEWGTHGIRVNAVNPGYTEHEMADATGAHDTPGVAEYIERFIPLGRRGRIDEVGGPVVFLASDASSYITGHCLFIDGGQAAV